MILFIFFALPVATILLAIVLQKVLKCPILVAITFFAIYLIVSFAAFSSSLAEALIATISYTIIAFVTAYIVSVISDLIRRLEAGPEFNGRRRDNENVALTNLTDNGTQTCCCNNNENSSNDLLRINCSCGNGTSSNLLTVSSNCVTDNDNSDSSCGCNNTSTQSNDVAITANLSPCSNNGGRTGWVRGCYRRM
jgi:hypothetical protein